MNDTRECGYCSTILEEHFICDGALGAKCPYNNRDSNGTKTTTTIQLDPASMRFYSGMAAKRRRLELSIDQTEFTDSSDVEWSAHVESLRPQGGPMIQLTSYSDVGPMEAIHRLKRAVAALGYDPIFNVTGIYQRTEHPGHY